MLLRRSVFTAIIVGGLLVATYFGMMAMPAGFVPSEDEGYFMVAAQLPDATSLGRTEEVIDEVSAILDDTDGIRGVIAVGGYSLLDTVVSLQCRCVLGRAQSLGRAVDTRDPDPGHRRRAQPAFLDDPGGDGLCHPAAADSGPRRNRWLPDGAPGCGRLRSRAPPTGGHDLVEQGRQNPVLTSMNTTFRAGVPQLFLEVDREKAKRLDVPLSVIFDTLQANLGSAYVNDFNLFGRVWKVMIQADEPYRIERADITRLEVRSNSGRMVPLSTLVDVQDTVGPTVQARYNLYSSASITGDAAAGYSSGQSIAAMEEIARNSMPPSMSFEWTGVTYQQLAAGGAAGFIFASGHRLRLSLPGRPVRELDPALRHHLLGAHRDPRRVRSDPGPRSRQQRLHPDRLCPADRSVGQERDPHHRVRQSAPSERQDTV